MHAASRDRKIVAATQRLELGGEREMVLWCVSLERSDLSFIGTGERGEWAAPGAEGNAGDEINRQQPKGAAFVFNIHCNKNFPAPE